MIKIDKINNNNMINIDNINNIKIRILENNNNNLKLNNPLSNYYSFISTIWYKDTLKITIINKVNHN